MLELQQVSGRVEQHERVALLHQALEPGRDLLVERDLAENRARVQGLEVGLLAKRDAEVPRVQAGRPVRAHLLGEMADQLVAEEVHGDPVRVAPGQLAAEQADVEALGRVQVVDGNGQVEDIMGRSHWCPRYSKTASVSARSPSRRVSSPMTPGAGMFP